MENKINQYYSLKNETVLKEISEALILPIVELGAGKGELTKYLVQPVVFEINRAFHTMLAKHCIKIYENFLDHDYTFYKNYNTIVGNIPYKLTKSVFKIIQNAKPSLVSIVIQLEVGRKLISKNFNRLNLAMLNEYYVEKYRAISKNEFRPIPPVDGMWLRLKRRETALFKKVLELQKLFLYPRKKMSRIYKLLNLDITVFKDLRPSELDQNMLKVIQTLL